MSTTTTDSPTTLSLPDARASLAIDFEGLTLEPKQVKFIAHYVTNGFNEVQALKDAGYFTPKGKGPQGPLAHANTILRDPAVVEAIKRFVDLSLAPFRAKLELEVMQIYYRRATYKLPMFFTSTGRARPLNMIPEEWLCCLDNIETTVVANKNGKGVSVVHKYILPDRGESLSMLYRMIKGASLTDDPDKTNLLPGEVRHKLKAFWESKDLNGMITKMTATQTKTTKKAPSPSSSPVVTKLPKVAPRG